MDIKEIIKKRRMELGLTLLDIAKIVGVSEATVSRWESGHIENMRRDKIALLAKALQISPSSIMGWDDDTSLDKLIQKIDKEPSHEAILIGHGGDGGQNVHKLTQEQYEKVVKIIDLLGDSK